MIMRQIKAAMEGLYDVPVGRNKVRPSGQEKDDLSANPGQLLTCKHINNSSASNLSL